MSFFSAVGLESIPYQPWVLPILVVLLTVNIVVLYYRGKKGGSHNPMWCSLIGVLLIIVSKFWWVNSVLLFVGLFLLFAGAIWSAVFPYLKNHIKGFYFFENKFPFV